MSDLTYPQVYTAIMTGVFDDRIEDLFTALNERIKMRRNADAAKVMEEAKPGDAVEIIDLSPAWMIGLTAELIEFTRKPRAKKYVARIRIEDTRRARQERGHVVLVPASCIVKTDRVRTEEA